MFRKRQGLSDAHWNVIKSARLTVVYLASSTIFCYSPFQWLGNDEEALPSSDVPIGDRDLLVLAHLILHFDFQLEVYTHATVQGLELCPRRL